MNATSPPLKITLEYDPSRFWWYVVRHNTWGREVAGSGDTIEHAIAAAVGYLGFKLAFPMEMQQL